mgnify:FL=1
METVLLEKTSLHESQLKIRNTVEYESAPYILKQANQYPIEKLRVALNREPAILLVLYELSIYEKYWGLKTR